MGRVLGVEHLSVASMIQYASSCSELKSRTSWTVHSVEPCDFAAESMPTGIQQEYGHWVQISAWH